MAAHAEFQEFRNVLPSRSTRACWGQPPCFELCEFAEYNVTGYFELQPLSDVLTSTIYIDCDHSILVIIVSSTLGEIENCRFLEHLNIVGNPIEVIDCKTALFETLKTLQIGSTNTKVIASKVMKRTLEKELYLHVPEELQGQFTLSLRILFFQTLRIWRNS